MTDESPGGPDRDPHGGSDDPDDGREAPAAGPATYPDAEDLPDVTVEEVDPFETDPTAADDLAEFATAEWTESTTARERVRAVAERTTDPKTAAEIADQASVATSTARTVLDDLAAEGRVTADRSASGTTYRRDPDWQVMRRVSELAGAEGLVDRMQELQREVAEYRETYGTDSPGSLVAAAGPLDEATREDVSRWRTAERDLALLRAAYRFREAKRSTAGQSDGPDGDATREASH